VNGLDLDSLIAFGHCSLEVYPIEARVLLFIVSLLFATHAPFVNKFLIWIDRLSTRRANPEQATA
jgi:hypothetical protein